MPLVGFYVFAAEVPNVPCGVERQLLRQDVFLSRLFLMYRVELKDIPTIPLNLTTHSS